MLKNLTNVQVWVHDQDEALAFYTEKLGMELRDDVTVAGAGQLPLAHRRRARAARRRDHADGRARPAGVRRGDRRPDRGADVQGSRGRALLLHRGRQATYEELKGRGVEFQQEPTEQPYGIDAGFRDPSGNQMRMAKLS